MEMKRECSVGELGNLVGWDVDFGELGNLSVEPKDYLPEVIFEMSQKMWVLGDGELYVSLLNPFEITGEEMKTITRIDFQAFGMRLLYIRKWGRREVSGKSKDVYSLVDDPNEAGLVLVMVPPYGMSRMKSARGKMFAEKIGAEKHLVAADGTELYLFHLEEEWNSVRAKSQVEFKTRLEEGQQQNEVYQAGKDAVREKMESLLEFAEEKLDSVSIHANSHFSDDSLELDIFFDDETIDIFGITIRYTEGHFTALAGLLVDVLVCGRDVFDSEGGVYEFDALGEIQRLPYVVCPAE